MGLTTCRDCGTQISTNAVACPKCGARVKRTSFTAKLVLGLIILGVFGSICSTIRNQSRQSAEAERRAALTPQQRDAEARAAAAQRKVEAERDAKFQRVLAVARP